MAKTDYYEKGQLTDIIYLILLSLVTPAHGYRIMENVQTLTSGQSQIGPASLYTTLKKLLDAGYIRLVDSSDNKKVYEITPTGADVLAFEIEKREQMAAFGREALKNYNKEKRE